jgi:hypothetical protein
MYFPRPLNQRTSYPASLSAIALVLLSLPGCSNDSSVTKSAVSNGANSSATGETENKRSALELPPNEIGEENMIAYAMGVAIAPKNDQFQKPFDDKVLVGRSFKVTLPYTVGDSALNYKYDADREKLRIWASISSAGVHGMHYLILRQNTVFGTPQEMSNAFGITKAVTPVSYTTFGLGGDVGTEIGTFPKSQLSSKSYIEYDHLEKSISINPELGRLAVLNLAMDVEGRVETGPNGHPISCNHSEEVAKMDYLYQKVWDVCIIRAKITGVTIHSPKLGVIGDWRAPVSVVKRHRAS